MSSYVEMAKALLKHPDIAETMNLLQLEILLKVSDVMSADQRTHLQSIINRRRIKEPLKKLKLKTVITVPLTVSVPASVPSQLPKLRLRKFKPLLLEEPLPNIPSVMNTYLTDTHMQTLAQKLISAPLDAKDIDLGQLRIILRAADQAYRVGEPFMSDAVYDSLLETYLEKRRALQLPDDMTDITFLPTEKVQRKLPIHLGSMTKYVIGQKKLHDRFQNWITAHGGNEYLITHKLDGASGLYWHDPVTGHVLYTKEGWDVSHFIPFLKLPELPVMHGVRGEFIMKIDRFKLHFSKTYKNIRNMIAGQLNSKSTSINTSVVKNMHFVVYEYIDNGDGVQGLRPQEQLVRAEKLGFMVVVHQLWNVLTLDMLSKYLKTSILNNDYEIDGLIITNNDTPPDRSNLDASGNPYYAVAFKENPKGILVKVNEVLWDVSKHGKLIPVVTFDPIWIDANVSRATAFNAKFVEDNRLGIGSNIRIIKSGGVIPHIEEVVSQTIPQFPQMVYKWDENHTHIHVADIQSNPKVKIEVIHNFLAGIGAKGIGPKTVETICSIVECTLLNIILLKQEDLKGHFGPKMIPKIIDSIATALKFVDLTAFMAATGLLGPGIGTRKLYPILNRYKTEILSGKSITNGMLTAVEGIGPNLAPQIAENIPKFLLFWTQVPETYRTAILQCTSGTAPATAVTGSLPTTVASTSTAYPSSTVLATILPPSKKILLTGFRDQVISNAIGRDREASSMTGTVGLLIIKDINTYNNKVQKATEQGIPIMTKEEFYTKLGL